MRASLFDCKNRDDEAGCRRHFMFMVQIRRSALQRCFVCASWNHFAAELLPDIFTQTGLLAIFLSVWNAISFLTSGQSQEGLAMSVTPHVRQSQTGLYACSLLHNLVCCKPGCPHCCIAACCLHSDMRWHTADSQSWHKSGASRSCAPRPGATSTCSWCFSSVLKGPKTKVCWQAESL